MVHHKLSICALVLVLLAGSVSGCDAQRRRRGRTVKPTPTNVPAPAPTVPAQTGDQAVTPDSTLTELARGNYGSIRESFVLVARDAQTYAALRKMITSLPDQSADFFRTHAVVAAFLGQRRTGGYGVEIKQTARGRLSIGEQAPPKGAMTTMALSAPFCIVALPVEPNDALDLTLAATWQQRQRPYRITAGTIKVSGGFAGISEEAQLAGTLRVMRAGDLATFTFDVQSTGGQRARRMADTATGTVDAAGNVTLTRCDAFALSGATESPFRATGQFIKDEQNLTLSFETIPAPHVADNFGATGKLSATATAPAPAKKAFLDDEPM